MKVDADVGTEKGGGGECRPGQQLVLARGGAKKKVLKKNLLAGLHFDRPDEPLDTTCILVKVRWFHRSAAFKKVSHRFQE